MLHLDATTALVPQPSWQSAALGSFSSAADEERAVLIFDDSFQRAEST